MSSIRPVSPHDEDEILALLARAFDAPPSRVQLRHKLSGARWSIPALGRVATSSSGAICAHIGAAVVPLNVAGTRHLAGVVVDFCVAEEARGQLLNDRLFDELHAAMRARGVAVGLSFPSDAALAPLHFKATRVAMLEKYALTLDGPGHAALRASVDAIPEDERMALPYEPDHALDARATRLWRGVGRKESLSLWKDADVLRWRHPGRRAHALIAGDRLAALAITAERGASVHVLELLSLDKSLRFARELLLRVADDARARGAKELRSAGADPWFWPAAFEHFERRPAFSHHVFARATDPARAALYESPINWTLSAGDLEGL